MSTHNYIDGGLRYIDGSRGHSGGSAVTRYVFRVWRCTTCLDVHAEKVPGTFTQYNCDLDATPPTTREAEAMEPMLPDRRWR